MESHDLDSEYLENELRKTHTGIDRLSYHQATEEGASFDLAETIQDQLDISKAEIADLAGITAKTLKERDDENYLKPAEVDRLLRVFKVILESRDTLETTADMRSWLKREQTTLGGNIPLELLRTEAGTDLVLTELQRIKYSVGS